MLLFSVSAQDREGATILASHSCPAQSVSQHFCARIYRDTIYIYVHKSADGVLQC